SGGAFTFGPQKGATEAEVLELDLGLRRLAAVLGADPYRPGCGAAGGTGYGLAYWGAQLTPGAPTIGELVGLPEAVRRADLVITGEGRFDAGSLTGKTCGHVLETAARSGVPALVVAGSVAAEMVPARGVDLLSLTELAGSGRAARDDPVRWLTEAGRQTAEAATPGRPSRPRWT
ncbi:MAG: glycerate 2-kinase, partial [Pseudonocardiales bacterium]|nr:glycerate 2-kinase [Pseudonocardiales bacterium]